MSKHSPGPWHVDGYTIIDREYRPILALGPGTGLMGTTDEENSRLVEAAPDMLELLRDVRWGDPKWHDAKAALIKRIDGEP